MAAKMATYIAKNKLSPRPEWQVTVKVKEDAANPFRILHRAAPAGVRQSHPFLKKRFPLVLMLEPMHACNLTCTGCGRIREYESTITQRLSLSQCLAASDECGAPMVSICGGEPMLYPEIGELSARILERGRQVLLCTNGMFIRKKLKEFRPHENFYFNVHLDGLAKNHDLAVEREGVFQAAIDGIRAAKEAGFLVCTNTTVYNETDMDEIWKLFELLEELVPGDLFELFLVLVLLGEVDPQQACVVGIAGPLHTRGFAVARFGPLPNLGVIGRSFGAHLLSSVPRSFRRSNGRAGRA